jgi:hypothetical protein
MYPDIDDQGSKGLEIKKSCPESDIPIRMADLGICTSIVVDQNIPYVEQHKS